MSQTQLLIRAARNRALTMRKNFHESAPYAWRQTQQQQQQPAPQRKERNDSTG